MGRGKDHGAVATREGGVRRCELRLPDPWLSSRHARILRVGRRWLLEDLGSKNGCFVQGEPRKSGALEDGDLVELGHSFFLFRLSADVGPDEPAILHAPPPAPALGLATLCPALARDYARLSLVAASRIPVLIEGETGTGKEVLARAIHAASGRAGAFVGVNCAALPRDLVEGELFGHVRGAFSGAATNHLGLVRAADGGTFFLDEIGDMSLAAQAALLRVLQEREVRPLGATAAVAVDFRVVAATNRPLEPMVASGAFRRDLLARLSGHRIEIPPLRARKEDLGLLVAALLRRSAPAQASSLRIHPRAARALLLHDHPSNVRELEQTLCAALVLRDGAETLAFEHLPETVRAALETTTTSMREEVARREELVSLLRAHEGNVAAVARALGKARMQVQRWLKRYGIDADAYRT
nr:sigma 54-interacting transcriptional regulator [Polyangium spumosum]